MHQWASARFVKKNKKKPEAKSRLVSGLITVLMLVLLVFLTVELMGQKPLKQPFLDRVVQKQNKNRKIQKTFDDANDFRDAVNHDLAQIAQKDTKVDFGPYMTGLQRRIRRHWHPPKEQSSKRVVVRFKITRNGRVKDLSIVQPSDSGITDQSALAAIRESAPFYPLPPNYKGNDVPVQFTFDYNLNPRI